MTRMRRKNFFHTCSSVDSSVHKMNSCSGCCCKKQKMFDVFLHICFAPLHPRTRGRKRPLALRVKYRGVMAGDQSLPYSSPETGSSHWLEPPSGGIATARWETQLSAAAPCQSLPSGGCPPRLRGGVPGRVRPGLVPAASAGGQQDLASLVVDVPAVPAARLKGHIGDGAPLSVRGSPRPGR